VIGASLQVLEDERLDAVERNQVVAVVEVDEVSVGDDDELGVRRRLLVDVLGALRRLSGAGDRGGDHDRRAILPTLAPFRSEAKILSKESERELAKASR
jgi:hypothetical protein